MIVMPRALAASFVLFAMSGLAAAQTPSTLHISIVLIDADGKPTPVPHHTLLVSDNPATAPPRSIVTSRDGTADVKLRPGTYTVESDRPVAFRGKVYSWTKMVDIAAGRDATLDLTMQNSDVAAPGASAAADGPPLEADPAFLLPRWQDSIVAIWTPRSRASGFVIDSRGLVATNRRTIGTATSVEVQLTRTVKVAASVLVASAGRDVALLWIDPKALGTVRPVPLACGTPDIAPPTTGQELYTFGVPVRQQMDLISGKVLRAGANTTSDFVLAGGTNGGPVFKADGSVVGLTSASDDDDARVRDDVSVVPVRQVCDALAAAEKKMSAGLPPDGAHLPMEPTASFPEDSFKAALKGRAGNLNPYQISSSEFDVAFITPLLIYAAQNPSALVQRPTGAKNIPQAGPVNIQPVMDFGVWSEYLADYPPLLIVRVMPRQVEGFWTTVARAAAQTQGVAIPPIKHFTSGFSRMKTYCGEKEVTPIHPFTLDTRLSPEVGVHEGLYIFAPDALGPTCGTVKLLLYSEKEPDKGETRVVDPGVLQQVWRDFAPYRAQTP